MGWSMNVLPCNWAKNAPRAKGRRSKLGAAASIVARNPLSSPIENLESRLLLTAASTAPAINPLNLASALFVQNQGQWADDSIQYAYTGQNINIGFTNSGPVLELQSPSAGSPDPRASIP